MIKPASFFQSNWWPKPLKVWSIHPGLSPLQRPKDVWRYLRHPE